MADLIVARLLPTDSALTIAVDDTLFKRSGRKVFGVAWHHDGAAKGPKPIGFGMVWSLFYARRHPEFGASRSA